MKLGREIALIAALLWSGAATAKCALPDGWNKVIGKPAHYVIFGEMHGTAESPAIFGETACALAERGERLLVAVELSDAENAGLQRAWATTPARFAETLLAEMPDWTSRKDGVTSQAMFAMLTRLHAMKAAGRAIDVVAFNAGAETAARFKDLPGQGPHEAGQADNIRIADALHPYDLVLVLVGNYHARKKQLARRGMPYNPMAMSLAEPARIVSLYLAYGPGTSWNCQMKGSPPMGKPITSDMVDCSAYAGAADVDWVGPQRIVATRNAPGRGNPDGAYDATFFIGPVTASPPASSKP